jgi:hypothetical protein
MVRAVVRNLCFILLLTGPLPGSALIAQDAPSKVFRYEVTVAWLGLTPRGNVLTNSNRVNFVEDLAIDRMQSQLGFQALIKPWYRGGIFLEVIPYRFNGEQTITKSFRFGGVTYPVNERVTAKATLNYFSLGYQYGMIQRQRLGLGLQTGVAYIGVKAQASSPLAGPAEVNRDIPFPLVGLVGRYTPGEKSTFSLRGEARGMTFGSYGHYFDVGGGVAYHLSPYASLEVGYRVVNGEGHHATRGAQVNFRGPSIALRFHDK